MHQQHFSVLLLLCTLHLLGAGSPVAANDGCNTRTCTVPGGPKNGGRVLMQDITGTGSSQNTSNAALVEAARAGSPAALKAILDEEPNVDEVDSKGHTALWFAARRGSFEMVEALLGAGADPNIASNSGMTPLYMACEHGTADIVRALLAFGADIEYPTDKGATPIIMASQAGNEDIVALLIQENARVMAKKSSSQQSALWSAAFYGYHGIIDKLADAGASVDEAEVSGATPLYAGSQEGHLKAVLMLIEKGADVLQSTKKSVTPVQVAAAACHIDIVAVLLLFKGDLGTRDAWGRSPVDSMCRDVGPSQETTRMRSLLQFAASLDKIIDLDDVLEQGVRYEDDDLAWIKRLLGVEDSPAPEGPTPEGPTPEGPAPARLASITPPVAGGDPPEVTGSSQASSGALVYLLLLILIPGVIVLVVVALLARRFGKNFRLPRPVLRQRPPQDGNADQMYTHNPLACMLNSGSLTDSSRTVGRIPSWGTPQDPRPTTMTTGSVDGNPWPLANAMENSGDFSRDTLLEWLKEPQGLPPSHKWDLEPQVPGVAKSEGSRSSRGTSIFRLHSKTLSITSTGDWSAWKEPNADNAATHRSGEPSQRRPSSQRNLWKIDRRMLQIFSPGLRSSNKETDPASGEGENKAGSSELQESQMTPTAVDHAPIPGNIFDPSIRIDPRDSR